MFLILHSDFIDHNLSEEIKTLLKKIHKIIMNHLFTLPHYYCDILSDILCYYYYISSISKKNHFLCIPLSKDSLYEFWTYIKPYSNVKIMEFNSLNEILSFLKTIKHKDAYITPSSYYLLMSQNNLNFLVDKLLLMYLMKYIQRIFNENVKNNWDYHHNYYYDVQIKYRKICHSLFLLPFFIFTIQEYLTGFRTIFLNQNNIPFDTISIYFINNFYFTDIATIHTIYQKNKILSRLNFYLTNKNANEKFNVYKVEIPLILFIKFLLEKVINIFEDPLEIDRELESLMENIKNFATNILSIRSNKNLLFYVDEDIVKIINEGLKRFPKFEDNINLPEIIINELFNKIKMMLGKRKVNNITINEINQLNDRFRLSISLKNLFDDIQKGDVIYTIIDNSKSDSFVDKKLNIGFRLLTDAI